MLKSGILIMARLTGTHDKTRFSLHITNVQSKVLKIVCNCFLW